MVEKVTVRLLIRCTMITEPVGVTAPSGSLWVWSTGVMTEGGDDQAKTLYAVSTRR
jgi:hypothetical protein